nr:nudix hydrolase 16, mitochondrial-like [Malus domestica]
MCDIVARTGRHQQRYEAGCRLVAGCIPFRYKNSDETDEANSEKIIENTHLVDQVFCFQRPLAIDVFKKLFFGYKRRARCSS